MSEPAPGPAVPDGRPATPRSELWLYAGAAASYIICGFALKQIFAWWWFGAAWFIAFVWIVPVVIGKFRGDQQHLDGVGAEGELR